MELKANNQIELDGETIKLGQTFQCENEKEARRLIGLGAAEEVKAEVTLPASVPVKISREDLISKIHECTTIEQVTELIKDETRVTVLDAAKKRIREITEAASASEKEQEIIAMLEACLTEADVEAMLEDVAPTEALKAAAEKKIREIRGE